MNRTLRFVVARARAWSRAAWGRRYDSLMLTGAATLAWGAGLVFRPAGVILAGVLLMAWAAIGSWTERRERRKS